MKTSGSNCSLNAEMMKGFSTKDSGNITDIERLNAVNFSMTRRRKSQGIDKSNLQRSAQKFQSKPGKIVANYLPSIHGAVDKSSDSSSIFQQQSRNSSIVGPESESDKNESQKEANSSKEPKRLVLSNQKAKP